MLPTLDEIRDAAALVYRSLPKTPQFCWPLLCKRTGVEVWVKHENHQLTGAFKVRGGLVLMQQLTCSQPDLRGVITATRGNHGQSLAYAARCYGLECVVVVPHGNSVEKNMAMRAWGAELIEHGDDFNDAAEYAEVVAQQRGLHFVNSFLPALVCGVATYWLEFFEAVPNLDAVYVPIGLGSGISAAIAVQDGLGLRTRIIGVVSRDAPAYALSFEEGHVVQHPSTTEIADGIAVRRPNADALEIIRRGAERIVQVTDGEISSAMRAYFTDTHNVAEGAGAAPLAALLQEREQMKDQKVGLVLCGGNVDHDVFSKVLSSTTDPTMPLSPDTERLGRDDAIAR
jgi:threonine dehydratase